MDVHRARFVPYPTTAITCLAFSRANDSGYHTLPSLKLAIGRTNGSVELWNPNQGNWVQDAVFTGDNRSVDGLIWTQDPDEVDAEDNVVMGQYRLFSIASSPAVTEWDLATGLHKRKSTGNFSEVWCFAAQPRISSQAAKEDNRPAQDIVAGCGDGTIVVLTTTDNDLQFKRYLARVSGKKARCMCITYQSRDVVIAGFADSMIRIYNSQTGHQLRTMSFGVGLPGAPKNILVWQVKCLPNGDIVSADSNGEVRIWDRRTYSLVQRVKGHSTDCLDLITSTDGHTIFSGSIDGKIAVYRRPQGGGVKRHWAKISGRSIHHGEVKAMAAFDSKGMSMVVLGGSGVAPMVLPLREYGKAYPRSLSNLPHRGPVTSAPRARLLVSWWNQEISIWRMAPLSHPKGASPSVQPKKLVASISLNTKQAIESVSITTDGKLLVASTTEEIKAFQIRRKADSDRLAIRKVDLPQDFAELGARITSFSEDGKWIAAVSADSEVHVVRVSRSATNAIEVLGKSVELNCQRHKVPYQSGFKTFERTITHLAFSTDSRVLAVCDRSGFIDSWVLAGEESSAAPAMGPVAGNDTTADRSDDGSGSDSSSDDDDDDDEETVSFYGQHWRDNETAKSFPRLDAPPLVFSFRPSSSQTSTASKPASYYLWVMTGRHEMYEFDMMQGRLSEWSRRNPTKVLPADFLAIKDRAMGAVWDCKGQRQRLWIYGTSWIFMLNMSADLGEGDGQKVPGKDGDRKRQRHQLADHDRDGETTRKRIRSNTGAGDETRLREREGFGAMARLVEGGHNTGLNLDGHDASRTSDVAVGAEDEDEDGGDVRIARVPELDGVPSGENGEETQPKTGGRKWWWSFEYRPILGMVPLAAEDQSITHATARPDQNGASSSSTLEVVIVERPVWEATSN